MNSIKIFFLLILPAAIFGQNETLGDWQDGKLFLKFQKDISVNDIVFEKGKFKRSTDVGKQLSSIENQLPIISFEKAFKFPDEHLQQIFVLEIDGVYDEYIKAYSLLPSIEYVERVPNYSFFLTPNDDNPGSYNTDITNAENAWNISTGDPGVPIAIIDDAFRMDHEDLEGNIYVNSNEIAGNGIDDDGNGYIDDVNGWDAADNDPDPNPGNFSNSSWTHGTHVAGIAAASTDNNIGIASIGFNCKFIPVKATNSGNGAVTHAFQGVDYALATEAKILSMSWGGSAFSNTYQLVFDAAYNAGKVCIAAAGNSNTSAPMYPASYDHVISVGATDQNDVRAGFSNYGPTIDVMAPGVDILSCLAGFTNSYGNLSGTSMACPFVSGICGLMLSNNPTLTPDEIEECLEISCDNIDNLNPSFIGQIGAGRVNAFGALNCAAVVAANFSSDYVQICPDSQVQFFDESINGPTSWSWTFPGGIPGTSSTQNPLVTYPNPGTYNVSLIVSNPDGTDDLVINDFITVAYPIATLAGSAFITNGSTTYLSISFQGNPPFSFDLSDGTTSQNFSGINDYFYQVPITPTETTTYFLENFNDILCDGETVNEAVITVLPPPDAFNCFYSNLYGTEFDNFFIESVINPLDNSIYAVGGNNGIGVLSHILSDGTLEWTKAFDAGETITNIVRAPNGDLILCAHRSLPFEGDIHVYRVDFLGNMVWEKKYDLGYDRFPILTESLGDTYFITSWTGAGGSSDNVSLIRIDGNGDPLWSKTYDEVDDQLFDCQPDGSGGCYFTGGAHIVGGNGNYFLAHIDADGNTVQKMEFDTGAIWDDNPRLIKTMDGGIAIGGQTGAGNDKDVFISKLDASWNHEWSYEIDFATTPNLVYDVTEDGDGNLYYQVRENDGNFTDAYLLKMNPNGNMIWGKKLIDVQGGRLDYNNVGGSNSLVFAGFTDPTPQGFGNRDAVLIHTDIDFNSCLTELWNPVLAPIMWTTSDWPISINNPNLIVTDLNSNVNDVPFEYYEHCTMACGDTCSIEASFLASQTFLCEPGTVTFNNTSVNANDYVWVLDGIPFDYTSNTSLDFDQSGTYNVTLLANHNDCNALYSETIEVNLMETNISLDVSICQNDSSQLEVSGGQTYSWSPSIGLSNPNIANPMASPSATTTYTVTISNDNCSKIETIQVTVDQGCCVSYPLVSFDPNLCENENLVLTNNSNTTGSATFFWDFGTAFTPGTYLGFTPPALIPNGQGQLNFSLTIEDECGTTTENFYAIVYPNPIADAGSDTLICDNVALQIGTAPLTFHDYLWTPAIGLSNPAIGNPIVNVNSNTSYILTVTDQISGCSASDEILLEYFTEPSLGENIAKCEEDTILLQLQLNSEFNSILWSTGSTSDTILLNEGGQYWVQVNNSCGSYEDFINVGTFVCDCEVYIPNSISANSDGLNDALKPVLNCPVQEYHFEVWDRWGQKIFETDDINTHWNASGKVDNNYYVPAGVYVWKLNYIGLHEPLENTVELLGHVTVLR